MRRVAFGLAILGLLVGVSGAAARDEAAVVAAAGMLPLRIEVPIEVRDVPLATDIAVSPDGGVWFATLGPYDRRERRALTQFAHTSRTGTVTRVPLPTDSSVSDFIQGPGGGVWFTMRHVVGRITADGQVEEFPVPESKYGPDSISADTDGNLWFTNTHKIARMTPGGKITQFVIPGSETVPADVIAGPDGNAWFTERSTGDFFDHGRTLYRIGRITPTGKLARFRLPSPGFVLTLSPGPDGNLWFTKEHVVGRITPAGAVTEFKLPGNDRPESLIVGPDRNLWFVLRYIGNAQTRDAVTRSRNWIVRMTPTGRKTLFPVPNNKPKGVYASVPAHLTAAQDGNVWFRIGKETLARITPNGTLTRFHLPRSIRAVTAGTNHNLWLSLASTTGEIALPR